jgi:catechol-2,3-dioxygenase
MIRVTGLNHAVLYVRELERSVQFYQSVFGFEEVIYHPGRIALLRIPGSSNHHDLGLIPVGLEAPTLPPGGIGLYHLAWKVETIEDLAKASQLLQNIGSFRGASDHGAVKSVYGQDPDGHEFEITWELPPEAWGEFAHHAIIAPLDLPRELKRYGNSETSAN